MQRFSVLSSVFTRLKNLQFTLGSASGILLQPVIEKKSFRISGNIILLDIMRKQICPDLKALDLIMRAESNVYGCLQVTLYIPVQSRNIFVLVEG